MPHIIKEDNQGPLQSNLSLKDQKHTDIKFHFVHEALRDGTIELAMVYCLTEKMVSDILTKLLSRRQFEELRSKMGLSTMDVTE